MDEQYGTTTVRGADVQLARQSFLTSVFGWMFLGLALTAGIAAYVAASSDMIGWFEDHAFAWIVMFDCIRKFSVVPLPVAWPVQFEKT